VTPQYTVKQLKRYAIYLLRLWKATPFVVGASRHIYRVISIVGVVIENDS
jgi:hypothetical protein